IPPGTGTSCEWRLGGGANNNNVRTAYGTGSTCPNADNNVGIGLGTGTGTTHPTAKFHVLDIAGNSNGFDTAIRGVTQAGSGNATAGSSICEAGSSATGGERRGGDFGTVGGTAEHCGVDARATSPAGITVTENRAIKGHAGSTGG